MVFSAASFVFISVGLEQLIDDLRTDALKEKNNKVDKQKTIYDYLNMITNKS